MKKMIVAQFLRDQAWWRLNSPGVSAIRAARSVLALRDAAACIEALPDDHPDLAKLAGVGCFRGGVFNPGRAGLAVVRGWELADQPTGGRQDILAALAITACTPVPPPVPARVLAARARAHHHRTPGHAPRSGTPMAPHPAPAPQTPPRAPQPPAPRPLTRHTGPATHTRFGFQ